MLAEDRTSELFVELLPLIEQELGTYLHSSTSAFSATQEVIEYAVLSPGKRLRPLLALAIAKDFDCDVSKLVRPSLALELFHASSLIHDDLPALDNDDYRRGRESCHKKYGEARAILAGDLLIAHAFRCVSDSDLLPEQKALTVEKLASSFAAVCEGQVRDIENQGSDISEIHRLKTASLFEAAAYQGVVMLHEREDIHDAACLFGRSLGLFYQAYNDLLDVSGTDQQRGRPGSSDRRNAKVTLFKSEQPETSRSQLDKLEAHVFNSISILESLLPRANSKMIQTRDFLSAIQHKVSEL